MTDVTFTLNGTRYRLSSDDVELRLAGVQPGPSRKHSVLVNGSWYPVMQAFEVALGVSRAEFKSQDARRQLTKLGFTLRTESGSSLAAASSAETVPQPAIAHSSRDEEWHTEASVQAALVTDLVARGYQVISVANTATKEHGIDLTALRDGTHFGIEVKGFPSKKYADPKRVGEQKSTSPSTQAGHWFAVAVLAAMRLRGKEPEWRSVIALPDFPRYRDLYAETQGSLAASRIAVWWVDEEGNVEFD